MRRVAKRLILASAFCLVLGNVAYSAGSYQKQTMFDHLVIAGVPHPHVQLPWLPQINPSQMLGG